jgi:hypothetical protein
VDIDRSGEEQGVAEVERLGAVGLGDALDTAVAHHERCAAGRAVRHDDPADDLLDR